MSITISVEAFWEPCPNDSEAHLENKETRRLASPGLRGGGLMAGVGGKMGTED